MYKFTIAENSKFCEVSYGQESKEHPIKASHSLLVLLCFEFYRIVWHCQIKTILCTN
jgi:hypothetical protein